METARNIREAGLKVDRGEASSQQGERPEPAGGALERTGLQICRRLILKHILERKRALAGRPEVTVVRSSWAETPRTNSKLTILRKPRRHTRRAQVRAGMSQARRPARKARGGEDLQGNRTLGPKPQANEQEQRPALVLPPFSSR